MKGRNCFACFWSHLGFEKLFNCVQVKSSFLKPVTLLISQREPFRLRAAVGLLACPSDMVMQSGPAAASFSAVGFPQRGRFDCFRSPPQPSSLAGHRLSWFHVLCTQWLVPILQLGGIAPYAGQPLLFSLQVSCFAVAGPFIGLRIQKFHYWLATVFFSFLHILQCGCARSLPESPLLGVRANRFKGIP